MKQKDAMGFSEEDKQKQMVVINELQAKQREYEVEIKELKQKMSEARKGLKAITKQTVAHLEVYYRMTQ